MTPAISRFILIFISVLLIAFSRYLVPEGYHSARSDEHDYLQYAQYVADHGIQGFRSLVQWYAQSEENRYHPSPARVAYIF